MTTLDRTRARKAAPTDTEPPGPVALSLLTRVLDLLDAAPAGAGLTITDLRHLIYHETGKSFAAVVVARALTVLIARGEAELIPARSGPKGGRAPERYRSADRGAAAKERGARPS